MIILKCRRYCCTNDLHCRKQDRQLFAWSETEQSGRCGLTEVLGENIYRKKQAENLSTLRFMLIALMGCFKSKHKYAVQNVNIAEQKDSQQCHGAEAVMVEAKPVQKREDALRVNAALLDYAQRLSEDIVNAAVERWREIESRYSDIPYIESDVP
ncbi:small membrane A-kinase anchor protein-like [Hemiscyllium ocellatum]|uniref:small membrane A-kinase anchor protein-like n=1 Tax=Hemiscyllium ocellatum TaxID=170820 RepID=UPI002965D270|nr:small membrane A-kinase anchor protein-like [Hemiscyllium ocellatum]